MFFFVSWLARERKCHSKFRLFVHVCNTVHVWLRNGSGCCSTLLRWLLSTHTSVEMFPIFFFFFFLRSEISFNWISALLRSVSVRFDNFLFFFFFVHLISTIRFFCFLLYFLVVWLSLFPSLTIDRRRTEIRFPISGICPAMSCLVWWTRRRRWRRKQDKTFCTLMTIIR